MVGNHCSNTFAAGEGYLFFVRYRSHFLNPWHPFTHSPWTHHRSKKAAGPVLLNCRDSRMCSGELALRHQKLIAGSQIKDSSTRALKPGEKLATGRTVLVSTGWLVSVSLKSATTVLVAADFNL